MNKIITPDQFVKEFIASMRKAEDEAGLAPWSLLIAWAKESPLVDYPPSDIEERQ
jgi:hypothetical protein